MRTDYAKSAPLLDEDGDLTISRTWLLELLPELRPSEFLYLVCKTAGVKGINMSGDTTYRMRRGLREKGLL